MKTKRLSLFLAFVMILSVFSGMFVVSAENTYPTYASLTEDDKAAIAEKKEWKIGNTYYADWKEVSTAVAEAAEATTVYLLTDTTEEICNCKATDNTCGLYLNPNAAVTIIGVTQADGSKPKVTSDDYRWFTVNKAQTVTVQNVEVTDGTAGAFQVNQGKLVLEDMIITSDGFTYGLIICGGNGVELDIIDSHISMDCSAITSGLGLIYTVGKSSTINITGSILDVSNTCGYRIVYDMNCNTDCTKSHTHATYNTNVINVTLEDSAIIGSIYTFDIMQLNERSSVKVMDNVVFAGGGDRESGTIFRGVKAENLKNKNDTATAYKHTNTAYVTTSSHDAIANVFGNITVDELAIKLGFKFRNTENATEAYADGAFTGYYREIPYTGGTFYQIADYTHNTSKVESGKVETNNLKVPFTGNTTIIGINDPTYYTSVRFASFNETSFTIKDLNLEIAPNASLGTIFRLHGNNASLTLDNVDLTYNCNYALIELKDYTGQSVTIENSTITGVTGDQTALNLVRATDANNADNIIAISNSTIDVSAVSSGTLLNNNFTPTVTLENSVVATKSADIKADILKGTNVINGYTVTTEAAEGIAYSADLFGNTVLEGAAVRAIEGDSELTNSGLRFMSTVSAAAIKAAGANTTYGTVIFRHSDYTTWMATNPGKTMADFIAAANANPSNDNEDDLKLVNIVADTGKVVDKETGDMTIYAALVKINNYETDFGAVSYIKTADGVIVYSEFDAEKHVRNITEVATKALADTNATEGYEENGYKYNIAVRVGETYYIDNGDGTYTKKTRRESDTAVYSPYTSAQREVLNKYLGK